MVGGTGRGVIKMLAEHKVNVLRPGDQFRDWLADEIGDRIRNRRCDVSVYKIGPASHTVCRYEFEGENYSVVSKFYAEPTGWNKAYDPVEAMDREYRNLKKVQRIISVPRAVAASREFNCALVTEYARGKPLYVYMRTENGLYDKLTTVAQMLRDLHDKTPSRYKKQYEFAHFHKILDQLSLDKERRTIYNRLLGDWWYSTLLDQPQGCMVHNDANPVNYVFNQSHAWALDFESSWEHANRVHDLGTIAAELKHYFALHKKCGDRAEPYIGHFIWKYCKSEDEFRTVTKALPFFMSMGLLRIARLQIDPDHGAYVFNEALACLKAGGSNGHRR